MVGPDGGRAGRWPALWFWQRVRLRGVGRVVFALGIAVLLAACNSAPPLPSIVATASPPATPSRTESPAPTPSPASETPPIASPTAVASPGVASELASPGHLTACMSIVGAPAAGLTEEGQFDGYNVAFALEIAERLGLTLEIEQPLFEDLIDEIAGHGCDISVASQNITAARLEQVSLVPYTRSIQPVLVAIGNPETIDSLQALCGHAVSATTGTTHVDLVEGLGDYDGQGLNEACAAAGDQPIDLRTFQTELDAVTALLDGEVVAYLGNPSFVFDFPDQISYSRASLPPARQGIGVALDHPALLNAVETALAQMISDGSYREILAGYLPNDESVAAVSITD